MAKDNKKRFWRRLWERLFPKKEEEPPSVVINVCLVGADEAMEQLDDLGECFKKLEIELDRVIAKSGSAKVALDSIFACKDCDECRLGQRDE